MKHHLMVGTWTPPGRIYTLQFDDEALTLSLLHRTDIPEAEPISWMAFSHDKKTIYGSAMKKWNSFAVKSPTEIIHQVSHPIGGDPQAQNAQTNTRAIFNLPAKKPPYNVYANPFYDHAGYGNIFSVRPEDGALDANMQNYAYAPNTGIHGMVFDPTESFLYSADMQNNRIWTHRKDAQTGQLTLVDCIEAPSRGDRPRWVEIHPSGKFLYVLMEAGNRLAVYVIEEDGDEGRRVPSFTGVVYSLVPAGLPPQNKYRGDVVYTNRSGTYLFATTRGGSPDYTGYISAFRLGAHGDIEKQLFINPTSTSGGHSNAVSPCDFSDEWLALCDDQLGFVEMYRFRDEMLERVARVDVPEPGFGMNAVWYD